MTVFVTGGSGFLGGHFLRTALQHGEYLICLRRPGSTPRVEIPDRVEWIDRDWDTSFQDVFARTDVFVHFLAAGVHPQPLDWATALDINVRRSFQLWKQAAEAGVKRFVIAGSATEYGTGCQHFARVPADAPLEPSGPYATSKAMSSMLARSLAREHSLSLAYIRPFNLYGEGQFKDNFWPALKAAAISGEDFCMTEGDQIRDYSRVEDAAKFFYDWVISRETIPGHAVFVNFGSGIPRPLVDYARQWWSDFNAAGRLRVGLLPIRKHDQPSLVPDLEPKVST
jgi:nucleoside-diphosphate-sugar epimerase